MNTNKTILLVEDDADDQELLTDAMGYINPLIDVVVAESGPKATSYLQSAKENQQPLPCLIVLDLNLPLQDGKQTYEKIKNELNLKTVPVIIFTSSHNPHDKALFEQLGVEFIIKPDSYSYMKDIVRHMVDVCSNNCAVV